MGVEGDLNVPRESTEDNRVHLLELGCSFWDRHETWVTEQASPESPAAGIGGIALGAGKDAEERSVAAESG